MLQAHVPAQDLDRLASVVGLDRVRRLLEEDLPAARKLLDGVRVVNVNSTAAGGGVAEMLQVLLGYTTALGIDSPWLVVEGTPAFFQVTKRIHNHLYGFPGDGGPLGETERDLYRAVLDTQAPALLEQIRPGDQVILHDPQTAGLARHAADAGARVIWRCHVGVDEENEHSERGWAFLRPELEPYVDCYVFSRRSFAPPWVDAERLHVIPPSVDPFSPKNQALEPDVVLGVLAQTEIVKARPGPTDFRRRDGSPSCVVRRCTILREGDPPDAGTPLVVQVSRWDPMKDMAGVMEAFAEHVAPAHPDVHLVLAGPPVRSVADDPEAAVVFNDCVQAWQHLPHRDRVHLVCIPMDDVDENATIVNALQRHATVVTQKSLAEGFGLTVGEAMYKRRPVVASAVGGIVDQVTEGTGLLVDDPYDLPGFAACVSMVLSDHDLAAQLGERGRERIIEHFLPDVHLRAWLAAIRTCQRAGQPQQPVP